MLLDTILKTKKYVTSSKDEKCWLMYWQKDQNYGAIPILIFTIKSLGGYKSTTNELSSDKITSKSQEQPQKRYMVSGSFKVESHISS